PPDPPTGLGQFKSDGSTSISVGGTTDETSVVLKGTVADPLGANVKLQVEVRPVGTLFTNLATTESALQASGIASVTVPGLSDATGYHWQARTVNSQGTSSDWVSFGGNAESAPDFSVSVPSASCPAEVIVDNLPADQSIPTPAPS